MHVCVYVCVHLPAFLNFLDTPIKNHWFRHWWPREAISNFLWNAKTWTYQTGTPFEFTSTNQSFQLTPSAKLLKHTPDSASGLENGLNVVYI